MKLIKKIHFLGLILIIPSLITGPFLPDLIVSITGIIFLVISIKERNFKYYKSKISIFFFFFNAYLVFNSLVSEYILLSLESSLFYFRFTFLILSVWYAIENYENFIKYFTNLFLITISYVLIDAYTQYFFGYNIFGFPYISNRLSGVFGDELVLGSFLSRLFPLLFALLILTKKNLNLILAIILLLLVDILVFLSGERLAFFNLILFFAIIMLLIKKWKLIRLISFMISLSIIFMISLNNQSTYDRMISYTYSQITKENYTDVRILNKFRIFSVEHENTYLTGYRIFSDNKIIGVGPKNFREYCKKDLYDIELGCRNHPHNFYLQLLSETGLVGFMPFVFIFIYLNFIFIQKFLSYFLKINSVLSDYKICILSCLYISIFPFAPSGNIFNNWISVIYFLPIGFLFINNKKYDI